MKIILTFLLVCSISAALAQTADEMVAEGNRYYKQTQWAEAESAYRRALAKVPAHDIAQHNLANALQKQKKYEEAAQVLEKLYGSTSNKSIKASAAYNGGVAQTKQKKLEASIEGYKNALKLDPNDKQARENLQKALAELRKQQQQNQQQQQKSSSSMDQSSADQKLKLLQEKEKELQRRMQNQKKGTGGGGSKDW